jgi:hypothetical protein
MGTAGLFSESQQTFVWLHTLLSLARTSSCLVCCAKGMELHLPSSGKSTSSQSFHQTPRACPPASTLELVRPPWPTPGATPPAYTLEHVCPPWPRGLTSPLSSFFASRWSTSARLNDGAHRGAAHLPARAMTVAIDEPPHPPGQACACPHRREEQAPLCRGAGSLSSSTPPLQRSRVAVARRDPKTASSL